LTDGPLTDLTTAEISQPQDKNTLTTIWPSQIINTEQVKYITHWTSTIKNQHKLECFLKYTGAYYLSKLTDVKFRKALTMCRLSKL